MPSSQEIIDYYAASKWDYRIYNGSLSNLSMHYGLWDETVHTHRQALLNENRVLAQLCGITRNDYVVDFGCGYGASAVWLASQIGCRIVGITLSKDQVAVAQTFAHRRSVDHLVTFMVMDFHCTTFADSTFDVAMSIESISHSSDKLRVLREAYRILCPGGRIAVADGFFGKSKNALTDREREISQTCFDGVHVPPLPERVEFERWLAEAGFCEIEWRDKTAAILPTAVKAHWLGRVLLPLSMLLGKCGVPVLSLPHMKAFINQYYAFRDGLGVYGLFCAKKPEGVRLSRPQ
jgi:cyclopropane fatty-acyl-phospholipid synthase-like methyltransferase